MTKQELIQKLEVIQQKEEDENYPSYYQRDAHEDADEALLEYINDPEVTEAFENIDKWYA